MNELSRQIQLLLPKEKQFLHEIYVKVIKDYSYLWEEFKDIKKLRNILLVIVKLFIEEHKLVNNLSQLDKENCKITKKWQIFKVSKTTRHRRVA